MQIDPFLHCLFHYNKHILFYFLYSDDQVLLSSNMFIIQKTLIIGSAYPSYTVHSFKSKSKLVEIVSVEGDLALNRMYPEIIQIELKGILKVNKRFDLNYFLQQMLVNEFQFMQKDPDQIWQFLMDYDYEFHKSITGQHYQLCFSKIKDSAMYRKIISMVASRKKDIGTLNIWNSELSASFFTFIGQCGWQFNRLELVACKIGNNIDAMLTQINLRQIGVLTLDSNPITNKGFKQLIKIDLPVLRYLSLSNICMTSDCLRLLQKKQGSLLWRFHLYLQKDFHYDRMFSRGLPFKILDPDYEIHQVMMRGFRDQIFVYMQHLAKTELEPILKREVRLNVRQMQDQLNQLMAPSKAIQMLGRVMDLQWGLL